MPGRPSRRQLILGMLGGLFGFTAARPAAEPAPKSLQEAAAAGVPGMALPVPCYDTLGRCTTYCYDVREGRVFYSPSHGTRTVFVYEVPGVRGSQTQPPPA